MDSKNEVQNVQELIAQYNRELMKTYRQQPPKEDDRFDKEYPMPNIEQDIQTMAAAQPPVPAEEPASTPTPDEPSPYIGYLQIYVYTGSTAEPIAGAQVQVSRDNGGNPQLVASTQTDRSGLTPIISLTSVDPMLSMTPQGAESTTPYVAYDIQVNALGFSPVRYENVPVYGGNSVTQPAAMLPLIEGGNPDLVRVYRSGGPTNLK